MKSYELAVPAQEGKVILANGYYADIRFDMIYKRWFYDLYYNSELVYAGIVLEPDTDGLLNISKLSLGCVDVVKDKLPYEPYSELGSRLRVVEIQQ